VNTPCASITAPPRVFDDPDVAEAEAEVVLEEIDERRRMRSDMGRVMSVIMSSCESN
jgi:hypothetical protein